MPEAPIPTPPYPRPPITEAVFAFHFANHLDRRTIDRFARTHRKQFPAQEQRFHLNIDLSKPSQSTATPTGYKLTDADNALVLIIQPGTISVAKLPPYASWEALIGAAKDVWDKLKKIAGHPQFSRLSTRYINRLDIKLQPVASVNIRNANPQITQESGLNLATYLQFGLTIPPKLTTFPMRLFQVTGTFGDATADAFQHTVIVASAPSPLIDHASFILDIDVATTLPISMREQEFWAIAEKLRERKNQVFEASITDTTRRLFA